MKHLTFRFHNWCKIHGISHGQPIITQAHWARPPGDYVELRLKAYSSRCMVGFLAVVFKALFQQRPNPSLDLTLMTKSVLLLAKWYAKLELYPYMLTESQANELYDLGMELFGSTL